MTRALVRVMNEGWEICLVAGEEARGTWARVCITDDGVCSLEMV